MTLPIDSSIIDNFFNYVYSNESESISSLLKNYPKLIEYKDNQGFNALEITAILGYSKIARELLKYQANPRIKHDHQPHALHYACFIGHKEIIEMFKEDIDKINLSALVDLFNLK